MHPRILVLGSGSLARSVCLSLATLADEPTTVTVVARGQDAQMLRALAGGPHDGSIAFHGGARHALRQHLTSAGPLSRALPIVPISYDRE